MTTRVKTGPARKPAKRSSKRSSTETRRPKPREVPVGEFKAKCLGMLKGVEARKDVIVLTRRGKPIAWICPMDWRPAEDVRDSLLWMGDVVSPLDEDWECER